MSARDRILGRLRAAAPSRPAPLPELDSVSTAPPLAARVELFSSQFLAAHAEVIVADARDWPQKLAERLAGRALRNVLGDWQAPAGQALAGALPAATDRLTFDRPIEEWKEALFESVDAGFSVADAAVAATGTLIFASGPRAPRTVSLVPPLHLALVHTERIHADLRTALAAGRWSEAMPTNLIMVSGPSKTADIQQTLAYGAHGPKELVVVVVLPEGTPS